MDTFKEIIQIRNNKVCGYLQGDNVDKEQQSMCIFKRKIMRIRNKRHADIFRETTVRIKEVYIVDTRQYISANKQYRSADISKKTVRIKDSKQCG